jgi:hypothetical protein
MKVSRLGPWKNSIITVKIPVSCKFVENPLDLFHLLNPAPPVVFSDLTLIFSVFVSPIFRVLYFFSANL